jgi:SOS response regulatory protein OraA/RecX
MLNQKGIDKSITEKAIKDFDLAEYKAMMGSELKKKRRSVKGTPYEIWARMARYGTSRGYEMEYMQVFLGDNEWGLP